jgi:hypothetical protein
MTILRTFANDLNRLTRLQFGCKYIFPLVAFFLTWGALGNFYTLSLTQKDLVENKGEVTTINKMLEVGTTQYQQIEYYPIIISLGHSSKEFRVRDNFKDWFNYLQDKIHGGDTVTLFTRSRFDALISWGKRGDIYEIDKNGAVIFPLSIVKEYNRNQALVLGIFAVVLWLFFSIYMFTHRR